MRRMRAGRRHASRSIEGACDARPMTCAARSIQVLQCCAATTGGRAGLLRAGSLRERPPGMRQHDPSVANFGAPVGEWRLKFKSHSFGVHSYPTAEIFGRRTAPRVRTGTGAAVHSDEAAADVAARPNHAALSRLAVLRRPVREITGNSLHH